MLTFKQAQSWFFDRQVVLRAVDKAKIRVLSKSAAFLRKRAQTSMRYRKRGTFSDPGQPPFAHKETGAKLRKFLFFSYDRTSDSAVVGPTGHGRGEVPGLQERGGKARRRGRIVTYRPRPYMAPALAAEEPKLPSYWTNTVRSTV